MPFLASVRRALPATTLFLAIAASQTCYYPDGTTVSDDTPCTSSTASSCCPSDSFCLDNGLCYGSGIVSRGSCTDATWDSDECASYCKTESTSSAIAITPCSSDASGNNTFACGVNTTDCTSNTGTFEMSGGDGLELRASQIATILSSVLAETATSTSTATASATYTSSTNTTGLYTSSDMASLGCGLGLPLFFALCAALFLLRRERQKNAPPKLMYNLPDDLKHEFTWLPPPSRHAQANPFATPPASSAGPHSAATSRRHSLRTLASAHDKPEHLKNFLERYETMKKKGHMYGDGREMHELDSASLQEVQRHELSERKMSC